MDIRHYQSGRALLAEAGEMLRAREAENSLVIGFAGSDRAFGGPELAMAAISGGRPAAVILQTSINEAVISTGIGVAVRALGRALAEAGTRSRGVVGPRSEADAAAAAFAERAGVPVRVQRRLLLHRLTGEASVGTGGGRLRGADERDAELLMAWARGFEGDTRTPAHGRRNDERVWQGIESGRLYVLEDAGRPVAAASWGRPTKRTRTINCVYTPPEERGRGRGRSVTALLARQLREAGAEQVLIFTDADDPTPNRVYARVGFAAVAEFMHREFVWPG